MNEKFRQFEEEHSQNDAQRMIRELRERFGINRLDLVARVLRLPEAKVRQLLHGQDSRKNLEER